jgi:hypothetical protein
MRLFSTLQVFSSGRPVQKKRWPVEKHLRRLRHAVGINDTAPGDGSASAMRVAARMVTARRALVMSRTAGRICWPLPGMPGRKPHEQALVALPCLGAPVHAATPERRLKSEQRSSINLHD